MREERCGIQCCGERALEALEGRYDFGSRLGVDAGDGTEA